MTNPSDRLDPEEHARIFAEKVVPNSGLNEALSHERPKAIILGGQPGAGKGNLMRAAEAELHGDVVKIDPDAQRENHSRIKEFQSENPYTWSDRTHADASQWAIELRDGSIAGKKNFIFDTTLSNGQSTASLIKKLQAKGYDVEVRAVAAHKLESEHGVDSRFSKQFDKEGHGRYVPADVRDAIYDKVPASLDTIRSRSDVPIRLYNREGKELYDSRQDARSPGQVLQEAREARLTDPTVTRDLNQNWKEQQQWHERLPETIRQNPHVAPETAQRLLAERSELHVVEGVQREAAQAASLDYAVRVHPAVMKGVGALGVAATAYDATTTAARTSDLLHQGNTIGAQSQVEHFAGRNVGGWAGAVAGAELAGAAGVETGPADLLIAGAGGIVGAVAGDKIADWRDQQRIYTQADPQGQNWHLDPKQPQQGWTRDLPPLPGTSHGQHLTAEPALASRLTYQANNAAVEQAMGSPPTPRDPYSQPASAKDASSFGDPPWQRDAASGQWQREIRAPFVERQPTPEPRMETATPQRAAELDTAAQKTMADNLAQSPRGIAQHYQAAYEQNGWAKFGPMPQDVAAALKAPENTLQASNGKTYTREADGQWNTPGRFWGTNAAEGNIRHELDATAHLAANPHAPSSQQHVAATPEVRAPAQAAAPVAPPIPDHLRDFRHPDHPQNGNYQTMLGHVHAMEDKGGMPHGPYSERVAATLVDRQSADHLGQVSRIEMHGKGKEMAMHLITRGDRDAPYAAQENTTRVGVGEATARPVEQVSRDWSKRELPHIHQVQAKEPDAPVRDPATLDFTDARRPDHPRHAQFETLRERIGEAYNKYGVERSDGQLDRATAAVMHDLQKSDRNWKVPEQVGLGVDPQTGKIGPDSSVFTHNPQAFMGGVTITQAPAMQQSAEVSFQQANQVAQGQVRAAQEQAVQAQSQPQPQGPAR